MGLIREPDAWNSDDRQGRGLGAGKKGSVLAAKCICRFGPQIAGAGGFLKIGWATALSLL